MLLPKTKFSTKLEYTGIHPRVFIDTLTLQKMHAYVMLTELEIAWYGLVERFQDDKSNDFYIYEVMLPKQTISKAQVTIPADGLIDMAMRLKPEDRQAIKFHGHSHNSMGVFVSGTDETDRANILKDEDEFFIFAICNRAGEMQIDLYDRRHNVAFNDIQWELFDPMPDSVEEAIAKDFKENVHEEVFVMPMASMLPAHYASKGSKRDRGNYTGKGNNAGRKALIPEPTGSWAKETTSWLEGFEARTPRSECGHFCMNYQEDDSAPLLHLCGYCDGDGSYGDDGCSHCGKKRSTQFDYLGA